MELIKVETKDGIATCNARELHSFLGVSTRFNDWIKSRIEKYDFIGDIDFIAITEKKVTAQGNESSFIDYHITIDMAKELSMVENNEKGKEARKYFIAVEKKAKELTTIPTGQALIAMALVEAHKYLAEKDKQIEVLTPKGQFYDAVTGSPDAIDMSESAKVLNIGIGRNKLFDILRNKKILMPNNLPYQRYVDSGYFRVIESKWTDERGCTHINLKPVVYQKGLDYIRKVVESI